MSDLPPTPPGDPNPDPVIDAVKSGVISIAIAFITELVKRIFRK